MLEYFARRLIYTVVLVFAISIVSFVIIQLPPGDFVSVYISNLEQSGSEIDEAQIQALRHQYGLDRPFYVQFFMWFSDFMRGDFGRSFLLNEPVNQVIGERLALTITIAGLTVLLTYPLAILMGIYSATHRYSIGDYALTFMSFIGLATPNFLLAMILMFVGFRYFGFNMGGLLSLQYQTEPWTWAKIVDLLKHVWVPIVVIGTAGTASVFRIMRGTLLDELNKDYVMTARSKGLSEVRLLFRYPVRIALNPILSTIGWILPVLISGSTIAALVLALPTTGPLLIQALLSQDMELAGSFIMFLSVATIVGTFISDLLLAAIDPRIRYGNDN